MLHDPDTRHLQLRLELHERAAVTREQQVEQQPPRRAGERLEHEVVVFHVMDGAELDFPFQEATLFRGLEELPELLTDPRSLRRSYLTELRGFIAELQRGCRGQNMDYVQLRTDASLAVPLSSYLAKRLARKDK